MAELIDKKALREEIESLTVHVTGLRAGKGVLSKFMDEYKKSVLRIVDEQPTTTEAEIRAKAISEFQKEIRDWQIDIQDNERDADKFDFVFERIYEIAEQLKGE